MRESHPDSAHAISGSNPVPLHPSIPRRVEEAVYLTAQNAERYRVVIHFFYQQYMDQRDWLTAEQVWRHVREHLDSGYTLERCEDDLRALVGWENLMAEQDRSRVSSLDEWHHRNQVYHITAVTIELERALEHLRESHGQRGSLDPSLHRDAGGGSRRARQGVLGRRTRGASEGLRRREGPPPLDGGPLPFR